MTRPLVFATHARRLIGGTWRWPAIAWIAWTAAACGGRRACGQVQLQIQAGQGGVVPLEAPAAGAQLPTDRGLVRGFRRAEESLAGGEFTPALRFLDEVLGGDVDAFLDTEEDGVFLGLKQAADRALGALPPAGKETYQALFGPIAERELRSAVQSGDADRVQMVANRYFHTSAGLEAAYLAAWEQADAGRHLAAALAFGKLLASPAAAEKFGGELAVRAAACWLLAGERETALRVLREAAARGHAEVTLAGTLQRIPADAARLDWFPQAADVADRVDAPTAGDWSTYRRDAARSSQGEAGLPHMREQWQARLLHPRLAPAFIGLAAELEQTGDFTPVAGAPLAVDDVVLIRTPHQLLAVDFASGKRIWQVEAQRTEELDVLLQQTRSEGEPTQDQLTLQSFARRMWEDYLYQLISSDGKRVFAIGNLELAGAGELDPRLNRLGIPGTEITETNRLTAFELATQGKRVWEIDGASAEGDLAGAFFLGAPTAIGDVLYALAEIRGAIYLTAIDGASGKLAWRQQLAGLEVGVGLDLQRRLQALMPSYEAGVLVCPTSAGIAVGVDLASRSLAWAYRYDAAASLPWMPRDEDPQADGDRRWLNGVPIVRAGRVLLTPPESAFIHCLDLATGRLLWRQPRGEMRQVAAAADEVVVLAGPGRLTALRADDGKPAWQPLQLQLEGGASLSGAGFLAGSLCYLPLSTGEVVALDVREGKIVDRAQAQEGRPLGNLISHRGALISHNGLSLDRYDQLGTLRERAEGRLKEAPDDVDALRTLGEMAYHAGELDRAVGLLEQAFRLAGDDYEVRSTLAECLAAALSRDFAAYRDRLPLLESLEQNLPGRGVQTLRIKAEGLLAAGEPLASAESCLQLFALGAEGDETLEIDRNYRVVASRWAREQLGRAWQACDAAQRAQLDDLVRGAIAEARQRRPEETLARSLDFFAHLPASGELKRQVVEEGIARGLRLAPQQHLLDLERMPAAMSSGEAIARHAALLHEAGMPRLAAPWDRRLVEEFAATPCLEGKTGAELVARWNAERPPTRWPHGRVEVVAAGPGGAAAVTRARSPEWGVRLDRTDAVLGRCTVVNSIRNGEIVVRDSYGQEFFRAPLEIDRRIRYPESNSTYGVSRGNLLVISDGRQLAAFNTLGREDSQEPAVLWRAAVGGRRPGSRSAPFIERTEIQQRPGSFQSPRLLREGQWLGVIGPVSASGCIFQNQRELTCIDPLSGQLLWSRSDLPAGCDLFGDERRVFATPAGARRTLVFSAADGRALGVVATPPWNEQLVTRGSEIVVWRPADAGEGFELFAQDAATETVGWRFAFEEGSRVDVAESRYVAAAEPSGRMRIIDAADGKLLVDYVGRPLPALEQLHLFSGLDALTVVAGLRQNAGSKRDVRALVPADFPLIDGLAVAFSRSTGAMLWNGPAEIDRHALMLNQPADLPLVLFLGTIHMPSRGSKAMLTLLAIDKATGRTLLRTDDLPPPGAGLCEVRCVDEGSPQVTVETTGRTLQFHFTDRPRPPQPPAVAEVEGGGGRGSRGLIGILENGILENLRQPR